MVPSNLIRIRFIYYHVKVLCQKIIISDLVKPRIKNSGDKCHLLPQFLNKAIFGFLFMTIMISMSNWITNTHVYYLFISDIGYIHISDDKLGHFWRDHMAYLIKIPFLSNDMVAMFRIWVVLYPTEGHCAKLNMKENKQEQNIILNPF